MEQLKRVQYPFDGIVFLVHETSHRGLKVYAVCDSFDGARMAALEAIGLEHRGEQKAGVYWADQDDRAGRSFSDVVDSGYMLEMFRDGTPCGLYIECRSVRRK